MPPPLPWSRCKLSLIPSRIDTDTKAWILNAADEKAAQSGAMMDLERAAFAIDWVEENCRLYEGEKAGELIELMPWQKEAMVRIFGWVQWSEHFNRWVRRFRKARIWTGKKNGKPVATNTPIPTPSGWTAMGDLKVGDKVFACDGSPTEVLWASPVMYNHDCYRIDFNDGTSIVADAEHLWEVEDRKIVVNGKSKIDPWRVISTEEMARDFRFQKGFRWGLPINGAIETVERELPLDPYVLGVWLGDGGSSGNLFTTFDEDIDEMIVSFAEAGVECRVAKELSKPEEYRGAKCSFNFAGMWKSHDSMRSVLMSMNVLNNKHIPIEYLRSSIRQRKALLQGLMDTDGYCSKKGQCEFTNMNKGLFDGFLELARSLGIKVTTHKKTARCNGKEYGDVHMAHFYSYSDDPCFRVKRKSARLKSPPQSIGVKRAKQRRVVAITPVDSVPVRCIAVDNPRHLYLAGAGMVATHNTPFLAALELYLAFGEGEQGQKVYTGAADGEQAKIAQHQAVQMVKQIPNWEDEYQVYENSYRIKHFATNSELTILTSGSERTRKSKEGLNGSTCWDELHVVDAGTIRRVSRAGISRAEPIDLAVSTAGLDKNCYGMEQFARGRKINAGEIDDPRFFHVDYALPDSVTDAEFDKDPRKYGAMTNPSWGYIIDPDEFVSDYQNSKTNPAERRLFFVYRLTRWEDSVSAWIDMEAWNACGESYTWESLRGRECYAGLDLSKTKDMTSLVLVFPFEESGKTIFRSWPFFWLPEERIEALSLSYPFKRWVNEGHLIPTKDKRVGFVELKHAIRKIAKHVEIQDLLYDPWKAEELTQELVEGEHDLDTGRVLFEPIGAKRTAVGQGMGQFSEPTMAFEHHMLGQDIRHPMNPVLTWQASHIEVYSDGNNNIKPVKPKGQEYTGKSIDGIVAFIMGLAGAVRAERSQPRIWKACLHRNLRKHGYGHVCVDCGEKIAKRA